MNPHRAAILVVTMGLTAVACRGRAGGSTQDQAAARPADSSAIIAPVDSATISPPTVVVVPVDTGTTPRLPQRDSTTSSPAGAKTAADLLASSQFVGKTVTVSGVCLGYRVPPVASGTPPRTRSDWQLESGGAAIYVTGPLPSGCSATAGSSTPTTIVALVLEDTLRALGTSPARPRRYLEWKGPGQMPVRPQ